MRFSTLLLLSVLSLIAGCDGHISSLNIRERPPGGNESIRGRVLQICDGQDVVGATRVVAESLSLQENERRDSSEPRQAYAWSDARGRFVLHLDRVSDGAWTLSMLDWPVAGRSEISKEVEARIRERLKTKCTSS